MFFCLELQQKQSSGDKVYRRVSLFEFIEHVPEAFLKQGVPCANIWMIQEVENSVPLCHEILRKNTLFTIQGQILLIQYPSRQYLVWKHAKRRLEYSNASLLSFLV